MTCEPDYLARAIPRRKYSDWNILGLISMVIRMVVLTWAVGNVDMHD